MRRSKRPMQYLLRGVLSHYVGTSFSLSLSRSYHAKCAIGESDNRLDDQRGMFLGCPQGDGIDAS
jgi:hypothetical protein